ncbi:MAG: glutamyl-tRNA reductase [Armatimonadota bacterium]|nr:glutamyl-tRNA reductase [Armatimonadota bacterium]MCX7778256.1 glutamyl-tRNA reductase [Armatimonadota bacterium]MDW8025494.1 glutamyl-tRNA reductase [Armatimonadota bacterium]
MERERQLQAHRNSEAPKLVLVGGNYRTMNIDVRERLSLCKVDVPYALRSLRSIDGVNEVVFLSTCNRVEIYAVLNGTDAMALIEFLCCQHRMPRERLISGLYVADDKGACAHLFRVAAGLDSMVIGEPQILRQIKDAYELAMRLKCCGSILSRLFMRAINVGKRVRTETRISEGATSIPHAAVHVAKRIYGNFGGATLLLIGVGEMGLLTLRLFKKNGIGKVVVANRTIERALDLAGQSGAVAISLDELPSWLPGADIIVSCTGSPNFVLSQNMLAEALSRRTQNSKQMLVIDLAVPRDVEPSAAQLNGLKLLNIDDLTDIAEEYRKLRQHEAQAAEAIVQREVEAFWRWWLAKRVEPIVVNMFKAAEQVRLKTLSEFMGRLSPRGDDEIKVVDMLTKRLMKRLLHPLIERLRATAADEGKIKAIEACVELLSAMSNLSGDRNEHIEVGE